MTTRRKSQKLAIAEALWTDSDTPSQYHRGRTPGDVKIYTVGDDYFVAVPAGASVPKATAAFLLSEPDDWTLAGRALRDTHDVYRFRPKN